MRMAGELGLLNHEPADLSHNEDEMRMMSGVVKRQQVTVGLCLNLMLNWCADDPVNRKRIGVFMKNYLIIKSKKKN